MSINIDLTKITSAIRRVAEQVETVVSTAVETAAGEFQREIRPQLFQTNFEKAVEFNKTAEVEANKSTGLTSSDPTSKAVFREQPKLVAGALALIKEEVCELEEAVQAEDMVEVLDALGDILVVTYGMAYRLGYNADEVYELIHKSNMSKFCATEEEARETVAKYQRDFAAGTSPYATPAYRQSKDKSRWIVYNQDSGKILKNMNYRAVDLSGVVPAFPEKTKSSGNTDNISVQTHCLGTSIQEETEQILAP
jgi:NTP pyrophosphatase (non-canonical NTP hydrolase)